MLRHITLLMMLSPFAVSGQYTVRIQVTLPPNVKADAIYMAGNFNGWNPNDDRSKLEKNEQGIFEKTFQNIPGDTYQFKFTRGSWETGETDALGKEASNRVHTINSDTTFRFDVANWRDAFPSTPIVKKSTASPNVKVIDAAFAFPQLSRTRRIWLYVPKDYAGSNKKYPVLYMHDGQNLFDDTTAFAGEWGVDDFMDSIQNSCIVVGIDNGGNKRMNEYNPFDNERFGKGEGKEYLEFLVKDLKPYIDKNYRTLADKKNTMIAGSSMGGLISFYAGLYYPGIFGKLGVFSPSFWINTNVKEEVTKIAKKKTHGSQKYYFYMGSKEGGSMEPDMIAVMEVLKKAAAPSMQSSINPDGRHNEPTWRKEFPSFYSWITQ